MEMFAGPLGPRDYTTGEAREGEGKNIERAEHERGKGSALQASCRFLVELGRFGVRGFCVKAWAET